MFLRLGHCCSCEADIELTCVTTVVAQSMKHQPNLWNSPVLLTPPTCGISIDFFWWGIFHEYDTLRNWKNWNYISLQVWHYMSLQNFVWHSASLHQFLWKSGVWHKSVWHKMYDQVNHKAAYFRFFLLPCIAITAAHTHTFYLGRCRSK